MVLYPEVLYKLGRIVFCPHGKLIGPEIPVMHVVLETKRKNPRDHLFHRSGEGQQDTWLPPVS